MDPVKKSDWCHRSNREDLEWKWIILQTEQSQRSFNLKC